MPMHTFRIKRALVGAAMAATVLLPALSTSAQSFTDPFHGGMQGSQWDDRSLRSSYVNLLNQQYRDFQNDTAGIQGIRVPRGIVSYLLANGQNMSDPAFVQSLYSLLLGRTASQQEVSNWTDWLWSSSHTRRDLVLQIIGSQEFRDHWNNNTGGTTNQDQLIMNILNTTQSYSNADFVRYLYQYLLNRTGSTSEVQSWVNQLNSGATRRSVIIGFLNSSEYRNMH